MIDTFYKLGTSYIQFKNKLIIAYYAFLVTLQQFLQGVGGSQPIIQVKNEKIVQWKKSMYILQVLQIPM